MHVYLIGMPGSGKSTLGPLLAAQLNREFLDMDSAIEDFAGKTIPQIFDEYGEMYFRQLEAETLKTVSLSAEKLVIATGGGTPCFYDNLAFMHAHGLTVYLKTSPETLSERLLKTGLESRPMFKGKTKPFILNYLRETLRVRATFYQQAGIVFESPSLSTSEVEALATAIIRNENTS